MGSSSSSKDDFSVLVLASDLGIDARPFLTHQEPEESWYDCPSDPPSSEDQDFAHLDSLQFFRLESGSDKSGNRIFRIVGKYFPGYIASILKNTYRYIGFASVSSSYVESFVMPQLVQSNYAASIVLQLCEKQQKRWLLLLLIALVISAERLKKYVFNKICTELPEGPFCIVYMHSTVQKEDNNPGLTILRWIYEELPSDHKDRLQTVYFVHPGIRSRLVLATLGRFFLSGGLYWKIKYVSRLQYLWEDIKKGELEIPEFVQKHDEILEHRPLTDYGIEPDPLHLSQLPPTAYPFGRHDSGWSSREYMS